METPPADILTADEKAFLETALRALDIECDKGDGTEMLTRALGLAEPPQIASDDEMDAYYDGLTAKLGAVEKSLATKLSLRS